MSAKKIVLEAGGEVLENEMFARISNVTNAGVLDNAFCLNIEQLAKGSSTCVFFPVGMGQSGCIS